MGGSPSYVNRFNFGSCFLNIRTARYTVFGMELTRHTCTKRLEGASHEQNSEISSEDGSLRNG
jgi:hypothetical protein